MDRDTAQMPLRLTLHERTYEDALTWMEDADEDLAGQVAASATPAEVVHRQVTLPVVRWIEVCEGLYGHGQEFGGTYRASAGRLAGQLTERIGGTFVGGCWTDDSGVAAPVPGT
jgi:hypothetical protein